MMFDSAIFDSVVFDTGGEPVEQLTPNGNKWREYQPTYHELRERREIERKFEEARLDLKSVQIKIDELEFKRLSDLADSSMQMELLQLLATQHQLQQLIDQLQQQKLRALQDDEEMMLLMAYLI